MQPTDLMPIGEFARRTGLTSSALRFYADCALLLPTEVDTATGYRYYHVDQLSRAGALRRLREIAMPLSAVRAVLDAEPAEAARMIDDHVSTLFESATAARRKAAELTARLTDLRSSPIATLKGPVLADAIEQVLTATTRDPAIPVLGSLRIEAGPDAFTLTATDRYRLSTRTLVPEDATASTWSATVHGADLRDAVSEVRRCAAVRVEASTHGLWLRSPERGDLHCRLLTEPFPDYQAMLAALPEATTRVTVPKELLLRALEEGVDEWVVLTVTGGVLGFGSAAERPTKSLDAAVTGADLRIGFQLTNFYPAISTAIGPDVMLDLRGPDQPVTVRSADRGDLTTLAMPVELDHIA